MPLDAWILLLFSVGLGLGLELAFVVTRRRSGYAVERSSRHEDERRARHMARRVTGDDP
jgi:hypothetical protein